MKKFLVYVMTTAVLLMSMPMTSFASEATVLVEKEEYQEITNPYELFELSMQQHKDTMAKCRSIDTEEDIVASQLIEKRVYSDGTEERTYATTSFLVLDENGKPVTMAQLLANNAVIEFDGSITSSGGNYNLAVSCTAYWEWKNENGRDYARCTHTTNQVVGNTSGQYSITQLDCAFKASNDRYNEPTYIDHVYVNYPTPYVMYTATNPRTDFFSDTFMAVILAGVYITYNDGSTYELIIDIKDAASGN